MGFAYVVEHMEDDEPDSGQASIPQWVKLEYLHMRTVAGPNSQVLFTNLSNSAAEELSKLIDEQSNEHKATKSTIPGLAKGLAKTSGVLKLMEQMSVPLEKVCLLDPKAPTQLSPQDGNGNFEWFLFGGILGDDPPRDRTSELRKLGFPARHLGTVQMTTDTAVAVTKSVVEDKVGLQDIVYSEFPFISVKPKEGVEMPFRYIAADGKPQGEPLMPPGMKELILSDMDKTFEFGESALDLVDSEQA